MKRALTIAGSDSGGGAGIQADLKTFSAFKVFGTSAVTAVTAQNTVEVRSIHPVPPGMVRDQVEAVLSDIPYHVDIAAGDSVVTSGYSSIFPEGILVGTISGYSMEEGSFYIIKVKLSVDFRKLTYVTVIENMLLDEQRELENLDIND